MYWIGLLRVKSLGQNGFLKLILRKGLKLSNAIVPLRLYAKTKINLKKKNTIQNYKVVKVGCGRLFL